MNQQQAKYTIDRINSIERRKLADLKTEYTVPAKAISDDEVADLIRSGAVQLKDNIARGSYTYLAVRDVFDLSAHTWTAHTREGFEQAEATVKEQANKVRDEVMLGDNAEALRLLREFAGE